MKLNISPEWLLKMAEKDDGIYSVGGSLYAASKALRYIAKPDTWFKAGTEVFLIDDYRGEGLDAGLFRGLRVCESAESEGVPVGTERVDEETCSFDEFDIKE